MSIFIVLLTQLFNSVLDLQLESESTSNVEQEGRYILARFMYDINRADSLVFPTTLGTNSQILQLQIAGVTYAYTLDAVNKNLTINNNNGLDVLNNANTSISNLNFIRIGSGGPRDTIKVSFTVTSKISQAKGFEVKNYVTTIGLR